MQWENKELRDRLTQAQYEEQGRAAMQYCQKEAQMAVPLIPPQACRRAMSSPSPLAWDVCQSTGVDCTEAMSSGLMEGDQCLAYAKQVGERRQHAAQRAGMQCLNQLGWRLVPSP